MWPRFCLQITLTSELIFRTAMSFCPDEGTAVEFAFGLHNPNSEFERDILKCILAIEDGCKIRKLILIGKPGADSARQHQRQLWHLSESGLTWPLRS